MKTAGIILGILVLIGCAVGLIIMSQSLGTTQDELDRTRASLARAQLEQQNTVRNLEEIMSELQDTATGLAETAKGLEAQKQETENYIQLYETTRDELENTKNDLTSLEDELAIQEQESQKLQTLINELQEKLALYEDTLGTHVYSSAIPPYHSGNVSQIILRNIASARNPTWEELLDFLREDKTDENLYVSGEFECGNFALTLHDNAESHGIRAAFVVVHFHDEIQSHALNAFKTTDKGLVYIDDTGYEKTIHTKNLDTVVTMSKDEVYQRSFLFLTYLVFDTSDWIVKSIEIYW